MKKLYFLTILVFVITFPQSSFCQHGYSQGFTASVAIPVRTSPYFAKVGYSAGYFEEFFITERLSVITGASMIMFKLDEDYKLNDYLNFRMIDVIGDFGPKFYSGIWYMATKVGLIWCDELEFAIMPEAGLWFEQMDIGLGYTHSRNYRYYEVKLRVYVRW